MNKFSKFFCTLLITVLLSLTCSNLVVTAAELASTTPSLGNGVTTNAPAYDDDEIQ